MKFIDKLDYKKVFIVAVIASILYLGLKLYNNTNLFLDTSNITKENYLTFDDYQLYDYESDAVKTNTKSLFYRYTSDYLHYSDGPKYKTSKGFYVGLTWDDFLKMYGDYYASGFSAYESDYEGERNDSYYSTHYVYEPMKVNDYNKEYIESGVIDTSKATITVTFEMYIKGRNVAFTKSGHDELIHDYYSSSFQGTIFNPRIQTYGLSLYFEEEEGKLICTSINTDRYVTGE